MRTLNNTLASKFGKFSIESNLIKGGESIIGTITPPTTYTKQEGVSPTEGW